MADSITQTRRHETTDIPRCRSRQGREAFQREFLRNCGRSASARRAGHLRHPGTLGTPRNTDGVWTFHIRTAVPDAVPRSTTAPHVVHADAIPSNHRHSIDTASKSPTLVRQAGFVVHRIQNDRATPNCWHIRSRRPTAHRDSHPRQFEVNRPMTAHLVEQLKALQTEHEAWQSLLADRVARRVSLANTQLRIQGAIRTRQEMSGPAESRIAPSGALTGAADLPRAG